MKSITGKLFIRGSFLLMLALIVVSSCKKKRAFNEENAQDSVDVRITHGEVDEVIKDVNTVIMEQYLLRGKGTNDLEGAGTGTTSICGAVLDTSQVTSGIVSILYQGTNCYGKIRSGTVKFQIMGHPLKKVETPGLFCKD